MFRDIQQCASLISISKGFIRVILLYPRFVSHSRQGKQMGMHLACF
jgi:hypothetical protein